MSDAIHDAMASEPDIRPIRFAALRSDRVMRRVLDWHLLTDGVFGNDDAELGALSPYFQIHEVGDGVYRYLHCGAATPPAALYGRAFARSASGRAGVPDSAYDERLREDYFRVLETGLPLAQTVRTSLDVWGAPFFVEYCRYIFPVTIAGAVAVNICSRFIEPPKRLAGPAPRASYRPGTR
ncbi:MAG: hypothetical protein NXI21_02080 [Alphaproteobacteria bacterium]|nr:hypothetical protein [Alphaproteobacteria bacterium]